MSGTFTDSACELMLEQIKVYSEKKRRLEQCQQQLSDLLEWQETRQVMEKRGYITEYMEDGFFRDLFYPDNYKEKEHREKLSLEQEIDKIKWHKKLLTIAMGYPFKNYLAYHLDTVKLDCDRYGCFDRSRILSYARDYIQIKEYHCC